MTEPGDRKSHSHSKMGAQIEEQIQKMISGVRAGGHGLLPADSANP